MKKINIVWVDVSTDCDQAGCSGGFGSGARVTIDGVPFGDFEPQVSCLDSVSYSESHVLSEIIKHLGGEITSTAEHIDD